MLWDPASGRVLGASVTGFEGVDKRLDVLATAIAGRMTVEDLCHLEFSCAPPFGSAKDIVNLAGFAATNALDGLVEPGLVLPDPGEEQIIDVRPQPLCEAHPLEGVINIPFSTLRRRLGEIDRSRPVVTICAFGKLSYFAARILQQHGFKVRSYSGGIKAGIDPRTPAQACTSAEKTLKPQFVSSVIVAMTKGEIRRGERDGETKARICGEWRVADPSAEAPRSVVAQASPRRAAWRAPVMWVVMVLAVGGLGAHEVVHRPGPVLIDTDMGVDDLMAIGLVLQSPHVEVCGVVAGDGASGREASLRNAARLLARFNRSDVALFSVAHSNPPSEPPPFRAFAEKAVDELVNDNPPGAAPETCSAPGDLPGGREKLVVLALGPFTNLASMVAADPALAARIEAVVAPGSPTPEENWNVRRDLRAFEAVRESGIRVVFVPNDSARARKPEGWSGSGRGGDRVTSPAGWLLEDLLEAEDVGRHYLDRFPHLTDELAALYVLDPSLFRLSRSNGSRWARIKVDAAPHLLEHLHAGRQQKKRVVFSMAPWSKELFRADLRERLEAIRAKNGESEWFAQVLMNEMHEHLGAYSILGVKMGLRAAELLNAPQHGMQVVSHTPPRPPVSCLNDGIIVATGSTPGRALFRHEAGAGPGVEVTFIYNSRRLRLSLRPEYQRRIREFIVATLKEHSLEDAQYWAKVRRLGLDIWENWHRNDLFDAQWLEPAP